MKYKAFAVIWVMLMFCHVSVASDSKSVDSSTGMPKQDYWMGIYYDQSKVGSMHVMVRKGRVNDKDGWIRDDALRIRFRTPGTNCTCNLDRELFADNNYNPVSDGFTSDYKDSAHDGYYPSTVEISFGAGSVKTATNADGEIDEKTVPISKEDHAQLLSGCRYDLGETLSPGDKFDVNRVRYTLSMVPGDGIVCQRSPTKIGVLRREPIAVDGKPYNTLIVFEVSDDVGIKRWQLDNGEIIREERPAEHLTFIRETKEKATEVDAGSGPLLETHAKSEPTAEKNPDMLSLSPVNADYWMGVYAGSSKIGYFHVVTKPDNFEGKDVFRRDESLHLWTDGSGISCDADMSGTKYTGKDSFPVFESLNAVGNSQSGAPASETGMHTEIRYSQGSVDFKMTVDGKSSAANAPLTDDIRERLITGCTYDFGTRKLNVGDSIAARHCAWTFSDKDGLSRNITNVILDVIRAETLELDGQTYNALVISEMCSNGDQITSWRLDNGEVIKQEMSGVTMVLESKEKATQPIKPVKPNAVGTK